MTSIQRETEAILNPTLLRQRPVKVFMVCPGLGSVQRGFESFSQECFDALEGHPSLEMTLFKGAGALGDREHTVFMIGRKNPLAKVLAPILRRDAYWIEQVTFGLSLIPALIRHRPDVVFFSDANLGNFLWHWRRYTGSAFKLLFSNGGPFSPPFPRWDHIQELTPTAYREAIQAGEQSCRVSMVPYGIEWDEFYTLPSQDERAILRRSLGFPEDRPVLLSVGAFNTHHKRVDYLIREIARLSEPRPFLMLLGEPSSEVECLTQLAQDLLGGSGFNMSTVSHREIGYYYAASDLFVLASLHEGFGRVLLEAMQYGLPCITHNAESFISILGEQGIYGDLRQQGALGELINKSLRVSDPASLKERRDYIRERYSWERLVPEYVAMIHRAVGAGPAAVDDYNMELVR